MLKHHDIRRSRIHDDALHRRWPIDTNAAMASIDIDGQHLAVFRRWVLCDQLGVRAHTVPVEIAAV